MSRIMPEIEIKYICSVIDKNINAHTILKDRGLLSENILSQLRNLIEDVAILINNKDNIGNLDTHFNNVEPSMKYVSSKMKYKYIKEFHMLLQSTVSHYTPSEEDAERLVLYYYRYICMIKQTLYELGIDVLKKLEEFPVYEDNLSKEHYDKICRIIDTIGDKKSKSLRPGRFYVVKCGPIYSEGKIYYEVTLTKATNYNNKFERILMYSKFYIPDNYSIKISYITKKIDLFSSNITIKIIDNYVISIRPCELRNIGLILNENYRIDDKYKEYENLMYILKEKEINLLQLILENRDAFNNDMERINDSAINTNVTDILKKLRKHIISGRRGSNVLRYLLVKLENIVIKDQSCDYPNGNIGGLCLLNQSIPFDSMPYAMSLRNHNVSFYHLINAVDIEDRNHELLGNFIKNNCENNKILYTPYKDVEKFGNIDELISRYNEELIKNGIDTSGNKKIIKEFGNVFFKNYEISSIDIINTMKNYNTVVDNDIIKCMLNAESIYKNMDLTEDKIRNLEKMFRKQSISIIHGPAGTGKTRLLEVLALIFKDYNKIYLANTNTSVENLRVRIKNYDRYNSTFKTISNYNRTHGEDYDILIIDECSMVSNDDMLKILNKQEYKAIILAGDVFQIEPIKYGNWFSLTYNLFRNDFVFELENTKRTEDQDLLELWRMIRDNDEKAMNKICNKEYSSEIDERIFEKEDDDEIILCLNYDGLFGINNINKILQEKNTNEEVHIGVDSYKINDPIVFNDCQRFKDLYNNLKGKILRIDRDEENDCVWFTLSVDEYLNNEYNKYEILEQNNDNTVIRFFVRNFKDTNEDSNEDEHIIPFNLAYAMSIHKAQGLEYNSVKIIISSNIEDEITKNIFYTAITRTKKKLKIFWSSETGKKVFDNFNKKINSRDISLLKLKISK